VITVYGIKNCDSVKKARNWLEKHGVEYQFHDFREDGLDGESVDLWLDELGWETLVNKRSTTWKELDASTRENMDAAKARKCIMQHPTLIKRPLLDTGTERHCGFKPETYQQIFRTHSL
jgi:Spx/MgsR family transcriptional regulator